MVRGKLSKAVMSIPLSSLKRKLAFPTGFHKRISYKYTLLSPGFDQFTCPARSTQLLTFKAESLPKLSVLSKQNKILHM